MDTSRQLAILVVSTLVMGLFLPMSATGTTYNSITADGDQSDWQADEVLGVDAYSKFNLTWNSTHLFIGVSDQDWSSTDGGGEDGELHIYLNTTAGGTTTPIDWGSSGIGADTLPFPADYAVIVDEGIDYQLQKWSGSGWVMLRDENNWTDIGDVFVGWSGDNKTEISINRTILGNPADLGIMAFATQENNAVTWASWPVENPVGTAPITFTTYYYVPSFGDGISPNSSVITSISLATWIGGESSDASTNTVWAEIFPGSSADDNAGTVSDGSLTSMVFYYTLDGSTPTNTSAYVNGTFESQSGINGNNDRYHAVIPASNGQTVKWFAVAWDAYGRKANTSVATFVSSVPAATVVSPGEDPATNTVWAEVYPGSSADDDPGTVSDGSLTSMVFYYTLDGSTPDISSPSINGTFDGQNGTNGNNDKYYAVIPAAAGDTVKWFAVATGRYGDNASSAVRTFVSAIPSCWVGNEGSDPSTNTVWAEVYPGSSADNDPGTVSDGSLTSMVFYYTLDGSTPDTSSPSINGTFDGQNGTNGNNDKYYAVIPASNGQTVRWFAHAVSSTGASNNSTVKSFISSAGGGGSNFWIGNEGEDPENITVWAEVYPGSSADDDPGTVSNGSLTSMVFYYTLDGSTPDTSSPSINGTFDGQSGINGNNDKYYAIIPAVFGQTVKWFASAVSAENDTGNTSVRSFTAGGEYATPWVGSEGSDPATNTVWADVYPGSSADDNAGTVSDGSLTSMVFYYTLDGSTPDTSSPSINGTFDGQNGTNGNNDKYYAVIPAERGQTVKWFAAAQAVSGSAAGGVHTFVSAVIGPNESLIYGPWYDNTTGEVSAQIYPAEAGDGSDTSMVFYYTLDGSTPTNTSSSVDGEFAGHNGTGDTYSAVIPASPGDTVRFFAVGTGSNGATAVSPVVTFVMAEKPPAQQKAIIGNLTSDPATAIISADIYPAEAGDGSDTSMVFHYTLDGSTPTNDSYTGVGEFVSHANGCDRYSFQVNVTPGQTVRWFAVGTGSNGAIAVSDVMEFVFQPPVEEDSDHDGMPDVWENQYGLVVGEDDSSGDTDGDGLNNLAEYLNGTSPLSSDSDGDGLPDGWEVENGLNPTKDDASDDADGDGLSNLAEYLNSTDPENGDSDGDGMPDGWEMEYGLDPLADDSSEDSDGDGLTNLEEYLNGTSPLSGDTDGDGMPDAWEIEYGLDPLADDSSEDSDGDGLNNLEEYENHTSPAGDDTDGDGLPDGWEVEYGLNPTEDDATNDTDSDGLSNLAEYLNGTNPTSGDTDGDGLPDGWEIEYGLNPNYAADALADPDGDGYTNLEEFGNGTDPASSGSKPKESESSGEGGPHTAGSGSILPMALALVLFIVFIVLAYLVFGRKKAPAEMRGDEMEEEGVDTEEQPGEDSEGTVSEEIAEDETEEPVLEDTDNEEEMEDLFGSEGDEEITDEGGEEALEEAGTLEEELPNEDDEMDELFDDDMAPDDGAKEDTGPEEEPDEEGELRHDVVEIFKE